MSKTVTVPVSSPHMVAEIDGPIGWMIFNKPERRNAVSLDMWEAIPEILQRFEADPAVRVVVLRGAGDKAFVSGADISQFEKARSSEDGNAHYDRITECADKALAGCGKPTVAMIGGYCIGGGLGIAVGCDMRIASGDSKFGIPAARLGVGYGAAGVKKLMDLVGPAYTKEIFYTARHFDASEALTMGLVNRVLPKAELEAYTRGYCAVIADNAPRTLSTLKRTVAEITRGSDADLALCERLVGECFASQDYVEGRRAFMEKRRPVFRGL
jgi:enoyl-CoA hydratase